MIFKTYKFTVIQKGQWKDLKVVCPKFCTQLFFLHSVRLMILSLYENLENALRLLFLHITLWIWDLRAYVCSIVDNTLLKGRSLPNIRLLNLNLFPTWYVDVFTHKKILNDCPFKSNQRPILNPALSFPPLTFLRNFVDLTPMSILVDFKIWLCCHAFSRVFWVGGMTPKSPSRQW